jgi:hypothetical protein
VDFGKTLIPNPVCKITSEIIVIFIIPSLEKKLMEKATVQAESEPVEILLERTNSADFKDTVSMENNKICCILIYDI